MQDLYLRRRYIQDRPCVVKNHTLHEVTLLTQNTADLVWEDEKHLWPWKQQGQYWIKAEGKYCEKGLRSDS
jgi:hypothetical protein